MLDHKKKAITEHWQFLPQVQLKTLSNDRRLHWIHPHKNAGVAGKCYGSTFPFEPSKHWFHKNRVQSTLNMDCSHRATGRHLRVMYET